MVTKQQQLEWLAKSFSTWPWFGWNAVAMSMEAVGEASKDRAIGHFITREEWQQERDKMQKQQDNSWHERGELPPVGCECEVLNSELYNPAWEKCTIIFMGKYKCIYSTEQRSEMVGNVDITGAIEFRPPLTEREKAIDEMKALCAYPGSWNSTFRDFAESLYDSGYRKEKAK